MRKITLEHLKRKAIIYVRQSSLKQVRNNQESQVYQRALEKKALELGWQKEDIHIVDTDLGISARNSGAREGFEKIVSDVSLSRVGIVFGYDVSRIARNCAEWYKLIELCSLFGTLIGDVDGIYNPNEYNDRLLLGLKGTMSEAELHILGNRLSAGRINKARRGDLFQNLPTGYIRDKYLGIIKDPDLQVQKTIEMIFQKFIELGSCYRVLRYFSINKILIPARPTAGIYMGELSWKKPTYTSIHNFLQNPRYAGTFTYGRRQHEPGKKPGCSTVRRKPIEEWLIVENKFPQYISWEQFIKNRNKMKENLAIYSGAKSSKGTEKNGKGLLQGICFCGECGRTFQMVYKGKYRYKCVYDRREDGIGKTCLSVHGEHLDREIEKAFLEAIGGSELDLLDKFIEERQKDRNKVIEHWEQRITRLDYEEKIAKKRYKNVDPENRLIASELEKEWEEKLKELLNVKKEFEEVKSEKEMKPLDESVKKELKELSKSLPQLWYSGKLSNEQKKRLLRTLIEKIIVKKPNASEIEVRIIWVSGYYSILKYIQSTFDMKSMKDYPEIETIVRERVHQGFKDTEVAEELNRRGFKTSRLKQFRRETISSIKNDLKLFSKEVKREKISSKYSGCMTVTQVTRLLNTHRDWVYRQINMGKLNPVKDKETGLYVIENKDLEILKNELFISKYRKNIKIKNEYIDCMTISQAAKLLGKHINWIHSRIRTGMIKPVKDELLGCYIISSKDFEILKRDKLLL